MRARNIKPGFFQNEELSEVLPEGRLLFIGLWMFADREGKFEWRPKKIKASIFPYDNYNIDDLLNSLINQRLIIKYSACNSEYGYILNFKKHQNPHPHEAESIIPDPVEINFNNLNFITDRENKLQDNNKSLTSREMSLQDITSNDNKLQDITSNDNKLQDITSNDNKLQDNKNKLQDITLNKNKKEQQNQELTKSREMSLQEITSNDKSLTSRDKSLTCRADVLNPDILNADVVDSRARAREDGINTIGDTEDIKNHQTAAATATNKNIFFNPDTNSFENITDEYIKKASETYPLVNIKADIKKMVMWLESTNSQKKYKNWKAFVNKWLSKSQTYEENRSAKQIIINKPYIPKTFAEIRTQNNLETYNTLMEKYAKE